MLSRCNKKKKSQRNLTKKIIRVLIKIAIHPMIEMNIRTNDYNFNLL
jgi:hypothetical protein